MESRQFCDGPIRVESQPGSDEEYLDSQLAGRHDRSFDDDSWRVVAAHRIDDNFHAEFTSFACDTAVALYQKIFRLSKAGILGLAKK